MSRVILSTVSMQQAERLTVEQYGISELELMEKAGTQCLNTMLKIIHNLEQKRILIVCGRGNNGGDGLVLARLLTQKEVKTHLLLIADGVLKRACQHNLDRLTALIEKENKQNTQITVLENTDGLSCLKAKDYDLVVDALFGIGLKEKPRGISLEAIRCLRNLNLPTVSIDVPSGLNADTGLVLSDCVKADLTVCMAAVKVGCFLLDGPSHCGKLEVVDIGIPQNTLQECSSEGLNLQIIETNEVVSWLPQREFDLDKYSAGVSFLLLGSDEYTGAAYLASMAAARMGSGVVFCASPLAARQVLNNKLTEVITIPLEQTDKGSLSLQGVDQAIVKASKADAALIGCGLGRHEETQLAIRKFLEHYEKPLVVDADAINALNGQIELMIKRSQGNWILTPHWRELSRLCDVDLNLSHLARIELIRQCAKEWNCTILLKGFPSLVALPNGEIHLNSTGNSAAATAGTGDVLAGICVSLLSQGLPPCQAAIAGIHIAGLCSDKYVQRYGKRGLLASDLLPLIPDLLNELDQQVF